MMGLRGAALAVWMLCGGMLLAGCPPEPRLAVSATSHHFGIDPETDTYATEWDFQVWNAGAPGTTLVFAVEPDPAWIEILPAALGQSTGEDDKVTLTARIDRAYAEKAEALEFASGRITVRAGVESAEIAVTTAPDYFTQVFTGGNGLDGRSIVFAPSGGPSYYAKSVTPIDAFPTDPAGGFPLDFRAFGDPIRAGLFGDATVPFYGVEYGTLFVSSAGWISFGEKGRRPTTVGAHFATPQISLLPIDADAAGAAVTFQQDGEKLTLTFANAPGAKGEEARNDTQVEIFFDGTIRLSFLHADPAANGVVGLSAGAGIDGAQPPDFLPSDLTD